VEIVQKHQKPTNFTIVYILQVTQQVSKKRLICYNISGGMGVINMFNHGKYSYRNFKKDYMASNLVQARRLAIFATVFYILFTLLDAYLLSSVINQIVIIRLIFTFLLAALIGLSYLDFFKDHWQGLFSTFVVTGGVGVIIISTYLRCPIKTLYSQGLLLVIFYGYTMNRLLVIPATIAGLSTSFIYIAIVLNAPEISQTSVMISLFFQFAANVFGIVNITYKQRVLFHDYVLKQKDLERSKKVNKLNKKLIKLNKTLNDLASTDGLTGIANRRHFDETLDQFIINSKAERSPLSLIMLDIDYFKKYNDYYGHLQGDECLKTIARMLEKITNKTHGITARFGGEEFTVLLPNTTTETASLLSKKIQRELRVENIAHNDSPIESIVTASLGVVTAHINYQTLSAKKLVTYADSCLYKAKQKGRNQISLIDI
jgi:diguanylate cyclase (GGDEF)-like protein